MKHQRAKHPPTIAALVAGGARWWAFFTALFFFTFPLWARPLLRVLAFILDGLNGLSIS